MFKAPKSYFNILCLFLSFSMKVLYLQFYILYCDSQGGFCSAVEAAHVDLGLGPAA